MTAAAHVPPQPQHDAQLCAAQDAPVPSLPTIKVESCSPTSTPSPRSHPASNPTKDPTHTPASQSSGATLPVIRDQFVKRSPFQVGLGVPAWTAGAQPPSRIPLPKPRWVPLVASAAPAPNPSRIPKPVQPLLPIAEHDEKEAKAAPAPEAGAGAAAAADAVATGSAPPTFAQIHRSFAAIGVTAHPIQKDTSQRHGEFRIPGLFSRPLAYSALRNPTDGRVVAQLSNAIAMGAYGKFMVGMDVMHTDHAVPSAAASCAFKKVTFDDHGYQQDPSKQRRVADKIRVLRTLGNPEPMAGPRKLMNLAVLINEITLHNAVHTDAFRIRRVFYGNDKLYIQMPLMRGSINPADGLLGADFRIAFSPQEHQIIVDGMMCQIMQQLIRCHAQRIVFRDVKPANILINSEGDVFLTDFGLAQTIPAGASGISGFAGTMSYMAPAVLAGETYDTRVDIYSLGVTYLDLLPQHLVNPGHLLQFIHVTARSAFNMVYRKWYVDHVVRTPKGEPLVYFAAEPPLTYSPRDRQTYRVINTLFESMYSANQALTTFILGQMMVADPAHCAADDAILAFFQARYDATDPKVRAPLRQRFTRFVRSQSSYLTDIQSAMGTLRTPERIALI